MTLVRAVARRLESNKSRSSWRVNIGIATFWIIVEDVLDAVMQEKELFHSACVSKPAFITLQDELMRQIYYLEDEIVRLNDQITIQKDSV